MLLGVIIQAGSIRLHYYLLDSPLSCFFFSSVFNDRSITPHCLSSGLFKEDQKRHFQWEWVESGEAPLVSTVLANLARSYCCSLSFLSFLAPPTGLWPPAVACLAWWLLCGEKICWVLWMCTSRPEGDDKQLLWHWKLSLTCCASLVCLMWWSPEHWKSSRVTQVSVFPLKLHVCSQIIESNLPCEGY